jgi:citronellol/citronellal dehydrogenase
MAEFGGHLNVGPLRTPDIVADAAHWILTADAATTCGNFFVDDEVLAAHGVTDLSRYAPSGIEDIDITPDFFVPSLRELRRLPEPDNPYGVKEAVGDPTQAR